MASTAHLKLVAADDRIAARLSGLAAGYDDADRALLGRALDWTAQHAGERRLAGGETLPDHALATAQILQGFKPDAECLAASLLCRAAADHESVPTIREAFGARVAELAEGTARMGSIEELGGRVERTRAAGAQLETLRKMLLAMAQDVRVVLIKLADHVQTLRTVVKSDDEAAPRCDGASGAGHLCAAGEPARRLAAEVGNRGPCVAHTRARDLPAHRALARRKARRSRTLHRRRHRAICAWRWRRPASTPNSAGGRSTFTASTTRCAARQLDFASVYDVRAVRVIVDDVKDCYTVLGIVHNLWTPMPGEFDDYIARPKGNDYRSLHTAVIGPAGKPLEIQIRTAEMHQHAELGVAAHWRYKEGSRRDARYDDKIAWLRQVVEWKDEMADAATADFKFCSGHDLRADAAGQGDRSAARRRRRSILPTTCTAISATAAAAPRSTARWCRSIRR